MKLVWVTVYRSGHSRYVVMNGDIVVNLVSRCKGEVSVDVQLQGLGEMSAAATMHTPQTHIPHIQKYTNFHTDTHIHIYSSHSILFSYNLVLW